MSVADIRWVQSTVAVAFEQEVWGDHHYSFALQVCLHVGNLFSLP